MRTWMRVVVLAGFALVLAAAAVSYPRSNDEAATEGAVRFLALAIMGFVGLILVLYGLIPHADAKTASKPPAGPKNDA